MTIHQIPAGIKRVLTVSAHPDDSEFYAGGTLAQLADAGAEVTLVVCTDGGRGGRAADDIALVRDSEQDTAAKILGITRVIKLGYLDGDLKPSEDLRDKLIGIIRQYQPEIVFGHHPQTFFTRYGNRVQMGHSDHRASATALADAIYPRAASPNFVPERGAPWFPKELWWFDCSVADHLVDITQGFDKKIAALIAHDSQQGVGGGLVKAAKRVGAAFGDENTPAEGFVRLTLRG